MRTLRAARTGLIVLLFLQTAIAQEHAPEAKSLPIGSATLAESKGQVSIRSADGTSVAVKPATVLAPGTTVETGKGSAVLNLSDGSQILIKQQTKVVLKSPEQQPRNYFELLLGKIVATVQKRFGNAPSFRMGTPTAVITVRGTRFSVDVGKKNKTTVDVYEGLVEVVGIGFESSPVMLPPGYHTEVESDRPPRRKRDIVYEPGHSAGSQGGDGDSRRERHVGKSPGGEENNEHENEEHEHEEHLEGEGPILGEPG